MTVTATPTSLAFGAQQVGAGETLTVTLSIEGEQAASTLAAGTGIFSWPATELPAQAAGESASVTVTVTYTPSAAGAHSGSLTAGGATVSLSGTGVDTEAGAAQTDLTSPSSEGGAATLNRYRVEVPTHNTTMVMGLGSDSPKTLHGFGIRTDEKFFVRAGENLIMQSTNDALIQSKDKSLYAVAGGNATIAGASSTNVLSPGGVLLSGGFGSLTPDDQTGDRACSGEDMLTSSVDGLSSTATTGSQVLAAMDAMVALSSAVYGGIGTVQSAVDAAKTRSKSATAGAVAGGLGTVVAATGALFSGLGAANASPWGGTTILGSSGVAIGSPGFSGFYSLLGLVNVSLYPAMMGLDPFLFGANGLTLRALNSVDIHGVREAHVNSAAKARLTAGATVSMEAPLISIGKDENPVPKTLKVEVKTADPGTSVTVDGTSMDVEILASNSVLMDATGGYGFRADATGVVEMGSSAAALITLSQMDMTLYANSLELKTAAGDKISAANGSLKFTAGKIDLN